MIHTVVDIGRQDKPKIKKIVIPILTTVFCSILSLFYASDAYADLAYCNSLRIGFNEFVSPMVSCFGDPDRGLIPEATRSFMYYGMTYYMPVVMAMATLMVALFGIRLMNGDVQRPKGDAFAMVFKIAGVFLLMSPDPHLGAAAIYTSIIRIMSEFNGVLATAMGSFDANMFCNSPEHNLWKDFDCIFAWTLGVAAVGGTVGIIALIVLIVITCGVGILIAFAFIYLLAVAFFMVMRFIQIYLMSVIAFSFMFALGYIFIPLIFFKNSFQYFQKWLAICLAYMFIPLIMYSFMALSLIALDGAIFTGPYSIMYQIFGPHPFYLSDCKGISDSYICVDGKPLVVMKHLKVPTYGGNETKTGINSDVGMLGNNLNNLNTSVTDYNSTANNNATAGIPLPTLDVNVLAQAQGGGKTTTQWLVDIVTAIFVAALLAYILFSLISYIPDMASSLVSQGTSAGGQVVKAEVFGQVMVMKTLELAKEAAIFAATGGASGAQTAMRLAKQGADMASKR